MPTGRATIAVIGSGEASSRNLKGLLNDQLEAYDGNLRFILPVTEKLWNEQLDVVAEFALKNEIPYEIVTDDSTDELPKDDLKEILSEAVKTHKVSRVPPKIVSLLAAAPSPKLFLLWDDDDDAAYRTFEKAHEEGVKAYDLCNGLALLQFDDGDGDEPEPSREEEEAEDLRKASKEIPDVYDEEAAAEELEQLMKAPVPTEEELDAMDLDELKAVAAALGIEVPPRTRQGTYIKLILAKQNGQSIDRETGEIEHVVPEEADDSGTEDEDEEHIPEEYEDDDAVEGSIDLDDDDALAQISELLGLSEDALAERSQLVGSCAACGGPIFAKGEPPQVSWNHASLCPLVSPVSATEKAKA